MTGGSGDYHREYDFIRKLADRLGKKYPGGFCFGVGITRL